MLLSLALGRRLGGRAPSLRRFSTSNSEAKSMYEHIMEYKMPAALGACCLGAVELRRRVNGARKQQGLDAEHVENSK